MNTTSSTTTHSEDQKILNGAYRKINWRLLPFLLLCYFFSYLDRVNIGFAKLQMQQSLNINDEVYGLAAGVFFLGYVMFEIPSNLLLEKIGARKTIGRIMILWGLTSISMLFVYDAWSFYILRFILGIFEAGFTPGMIVYLTFWYSGARMARVMSMVMLAVPLAGAIGSPLSTWIMQTMHHTSSLEGWQWLFLLEGLPTVILGIMTFFYLDNRPTEATWLTEQEKHLLNQAIVAQKNAPHHCFKTVLKDPRVYCLSFAYFAIVTAMYAVAFWLPTIIRNSGITNLHHIGGYTAIPYVLSAIVMYKIAKSSDHQQERRYHATIPMLIAIMALVVAIVYDHEFSIAFTALSMGTAALFATYTIFWSIPSQYLTGTAAAGGIALINCLGITGGFFSPILMSQTQKFTQSLNSGWIVITILISLGCVFLFIAAGRTPKVATHI